MEVIYSYLNKLSKLMTTYSLTHKSNKIEIGVNEIMVNDSEMCVRWNNEAWLIPEISVLR